MDKDRYMQSALMGAFGDQPRGEQTTDEAESDDDTTVYPSTQQELPGID